MLLKSTFLVVTVFVHICCTVLPAASFSLEDERKLGREFYEKLREKGMLSDNQRINAFIESVGRKVLAHSGKPVFDFTFSVVNASGINAFATPGGYVYIFPGLVKIAENESQIAGVIAHEIAHVNARHIAQSIEKAQKMNIATLAAILAGSFLGGEAAAAVSAFSIATATHMTLKYSRDNEEDADRLGLSYLSKAGYDCRSVVDFLAIMRRYEYYSSAVPSYFLTHPGTTDRMTYIDGLLASIYKNRGVSSIVGGFSRIKTLSILADEDRHGQIRYFEDELTKNPDDLDALYGIAFAYESAGYAEKALEFFKRAAKQAPDDPDILRGLGGAYLKMGDTGTALLTLQSAYRQHPTDPEIMMSLARASERAERHDQAIALYEKLLEIRPEDQTLQYNIAMAYGKSNRLADSHYYFGLFFKQKGKAKTALFHFKAALEHTPPENARFGELQQQIQSLSKEIPAARQQPAQ
ncbi:MAG: M48 family metalloprotease [Deltaproteobacteria bacterium]|nr:M48 family metalloprotease [Deltaproteobacteria bacterium]